MHCRARSSRTAENSAPHLILAMLCQRLLRRNTIMIALANRVPRTLMTEIIEKEQLLESSGYRYHFDRMIYFNRSVRRAFSLEFVEDNSHQEIQKLLATP